MENNELILDMSNRKVKHEKEVEELKSKNRASESEIVLPLKSEGDNKPQIEYEIINKIYEDIERDGFVPTIQCCFGSITPIWTIPELPKSLLGLSMDELELSVRAYNCLKRSGIHTVEDFFKPKEEYLFCDRCISRKSIEEVIIKLSERDYNMRNEEEQKQYVKELYELNKDNFFKNSKIMLQ